MFLIISLKYQTTKQSFYLLRFAWVHKSKDNNKPNVKETFDTSYIWASLADKQFRWSYGLKYVSPEDCGS